MENININYEKLTPEDLVNLWRKDEREIIQEMLASGNFSGITGRKEIKR